MEGYRGGVEFLTDNAISSRLLLRPGARGLGHP